jgi:hypothetical protein
MQLLARDDTVMVQIHLFKHSLRVFGGGGTGREGGGKGGGEEESEGKRREESRGRQRQGAGHNLAKYRRASVQGQHKDAQDAVLVLRHDIIHTGDSCSRQVCWDIPLLSFQHMHAVRTAMSCSVLQCPAVSYSVLQCPTVSCSVLQCTAVKYCSEVLQCTAAPRLTLSRVSSLLCSTPGVVTAAATMSLRARRFTRAAPVNAPRRCM